MLKKGNMAIEKHISSNNETSDVKSLSFPLKVSEKEKLADIEVLPDGDDVDVDCREVYFLIMHFLSSGPCQRTCGQFWNELLEHDLLPRRYHAWYSRSGAPSGDENDDGLSFPLSYNKVVERFPHIKKDHLVKLLKQLLLNKIQPQQGMVARNVPNAADVPTLLGTGSFSLLDYDGNKESNEFKTPVYMRWPHMQADQVRGLRLREIGGGFSRHHRAPSTRAACYAIVKPSIMVQKMQNIKKTRGHRNAVYCATFDRSGRFAITGSDDRLVKIWSMETAYCLASCRGHEGDITDLAVSSNNALVASSSNDFIIRVWRLPDGQPISVLRGHTGAVTAIVFSPRPSAVYQLLSSADDGTCRLWDARYSQFKPRVYLPKPSDSVGGKSSAASSSSAGQQNHQIFCCAFNASGTVFVTGSSDNLARVWNACKSGTDDSEQPIHEMDVLSGHENDVNYVQFSGCAVSARLSGADTTTKEENFPKFKNSWFAHDNIVTCSRDGSAIIWTPRSRKSHGKAGRWTRAYHLKVPPPPMPPQPPRGGPRQRVLPTPRGVNMIAWSLDNRFVLAAIMDCRICVWNAVDGSLVHSLTGHTESTYVLDVHPFNPRIAMSAGYDGKTIIWDIWEGKPIRTYEIGRFKLVDGKFSPDGTSIVLSDDVGQLYILSTGQGESQKDAEYDQFFLGDYRPLIRDTHGNVVDQETQLPPYRRNMQDLLCDSSMIPYPEPYQSLYQQRRLGILGIEWRPSTVRFAVGPDFNSDQDQILPLPDLDVLIDPLPEFVDAMDWEPEVEIISDDADSEFNITDSLGDEDEGHTISTSSGGSECGDEGSGPECSDKDSIRRSKRRKKKREMEITSSGRRVKRRNLDECDGSSHRVHAPRKSRNGPKSSRKKSSNGSRPRRAAARNALTLFSKIKGRSSDQDDNCSENESSESDSAIDDSNLESDESDEVPDKVTKQLKGKEVLLDFSESVPIPEGLCESNEKSSARRRLVLKLPVTDSTRDLFSENLITKPENPTDLAGSSASASASGVLDGDGRDPTQQDMDSFCGNDGVINDKGVRWLAGYGSDIMKWGGFKARTPKRIRLNKTLSSSALGSIVLSNMHNDEKNNADLKHATEEGSEDDGGKEGLEKLCKINEEPLCTSNMKDLTNAELSGPLDSDGVQNDASVVPSLGAPCSVSTENPDSQLPITDNETHGEFSVGPRSMSYVGGSSNANHKKENHNEENPCEASSESKDPSLIQKSEDQNGQNGSTGSLVDSLASHSPRIDRMYSAVYRRSRSLKTAKASLNSHDPRMSESTSNLCCQDANGNADTNGSVNNDTHVVVSTEPSHTVEEEACNGDKLPEWPRRAESSPSKKGGQLSREEWGSGMTVRQRSTRNRRVNFIRDLSPIDRKSSQPQRKQSWLMFSLPDSSRYIPQQGDDVVYLRQGHQEYMSYSRSSARGPWELLKGEIRAVEFCKIVELEYSTVPGSGDSCCKLTLAFTDPSASVFGKTFKLSLPEVTSFPDFLVERMRYDAAIQRNWAVRDKCQVWWKNEGEEDGSWWEGRILAVKPKSPDFPDSPWERYHIRYKSDPAETHSHSPWELHDAEMQWDRPHLEDHTRKKLLAALSKLVQTGNRAKDIYGVQKLRQVSEKTTFLNRFPVPLSIDVIFSRVENNYYRSSEALKHDVKVMLSNAESFFGKNAELSKKIARLAEWFDQTLSSL